MGFIWVMSWSLFGSCPGVYWGCVLELWGHVLGFWDHSPGHTRVGITFWDAPGSSPGIRLGSQPKIHVASLSSFLPKPAAQWVFSKAPWWSSS